MYSFVSLPILVLEKMKPLSIRIEKKYENKKIKLICYFFIILMVMCACNTTKGTLSNSNQTNNASLEESVEIVVFAAASLTETLTQLGNQYMEKEKNIKLLFNFDSSGTLKTQIQEGADVDLFISAGQKQMDQLDIQVSTEVNTENLDFVLEGTRRNLLENKVVLVVSEENQYETTSFNDMATRLQEGSILLAIGNADVPVGQYTKNILDFYGLQEEQLADKGVISYGSNVKEVTTQVAEQLVDCGIIYQTDAFSAGLTIVDTATTEMCGRVIYPAAVMRVSKHQQEAKDFLDYLVSKEASVVFESVGFTPFG